MATDIIMPALGMAQETGLLVEWLKNEGDTVKKGEPIMVVETDKVTVEIESPGTGILSNVSVQAGTDVPVGQVIALLLAEGEEAPASLPSAPVPQKSDSTSASTPQPAPPSPAPTSVTMPHSNGGHNGGVAVVSPVAARMAAAHGIDPSAVPAKGGRIEKADVQAYLDSLHMHAAASDTAERGLVLASPKARRLASEMGYDLALISGQGPDGAVLAADVLAFEPAALQTVALSPSTEDMELSRAWRIMAQRLTEAWTSIPHFYLMREVDVTRFIDWHRAVQAKTSIKVTYTDLLIKLVAAALRDHPRANAFWNDGGVLLNTQINVGIATAVEDGLLVPVVHDADRLTISEIAARRFEIVTRAQNGKLEPADLQHGTFTISNLGMFGVDAFSAIVNPPQAGILAVGRIADRVVAVDGQPAVRPMMVLNMSFDHRTIDGARGAQFMKTLVGYLEEPLNLLE